MKDNKGDCSFLLFIL